MVCTRHLRAVPVQTEHKPQSLATISVVVGLAMALALVTR